MSAYDGKVYVFGGWDGRGYVNTTFIYDPKTDRWTTGAPLPVGRGFAGAATLNDAIYVVGGYADDHESIAVIAICPRKIAGRRARPCRWRAAA